jgi:hypothetical protein
MFDYFPNRRSNRSDNTCEALRLQLQIIAKRAGFSSIVLGDDIGLVVASAGNKSISDYLAAVAPELTSGGKAWHGRLPTNKGEVLLHIAPIRFDDSYLYLSALEGSGNSIIKELFIGGRGVVRILNN